MKNALLIVIAFVLGGAAVWYFAGGNAKFFAAGPQAGGAAGAGFPGGGRPGAGGFGASQPPLVTVSRVKKDRVYDTVEALGTAQANESVTINAKVTDTVRHVNFSDGDYVDAGAVLAELTNQEEEASLAEARANLEDAENELRRQEDINAKGLGSKSTLDTARSRVAAQQARYNAVVARLKDRLILAPFGGLLGFRQVSPGTMVSPNTAITTIDDVSTIKLDFTVPESFLASMVPGARVIAQSVSYPNRNFEGIVKTVGSRIDPITRAATVRAHIPNADRSLRPGMLLTVQVLTAQHLALVVPESAVFQVQNRAYVYRVDDFVAHQQQVEVGGRHFGTAEVLSGLQEGDVIVVEGIVKLREGIKVRYEGEGDSEVSQRVGGPGKAGAGNAGG
ncbi:MAG TPA: efflux RND transporter periplasmic adaptor subunit [Gammaproteobacteria bacterium]|jgi:membrane fusion protein (multidrug efflux system)|nr:efflux RND transporter periplasmic adaptor subunit [Gammaproteobacteria bacterium]